MGLFAEVQFSWRERDYTLPPERILRTIAQVETVITLGELGAIETIGKMPLAKIAQAFGIMLRAAGANVSDEDVYGGIFDDPLTLSKNAWSAVLTLQALMLPPEKLASPAKPGKETDEETRAASSSRPTSS